MYYMTDISLSAALYLHWTFLLRRGRCCKRALISTFAGTLNIWPETSEPSWKTASKNWAATLRSRFGLPSWQYQRFWKEPLIVNLVFIAGWFRILTRLIVSFLFRILAGFRCFVFTLISGCRLHEANASERQIADGRMELTDLVSSPRHRDCCKTAFVAYMFSLLYALFLAFALLSYSQFCGIRGFLIAVSWNYIRW